jgi:hypothetical protein
VPRHDVADKPWLVANILASRGCSRHPPTHTRFMSSRVVQIPCKLDSEKLTAHQDPPPPTHPHSRDRSPFCCPVTASHRSQTPIDFIMTTKSIALIVASIATSTVAQVSETTNIMSYHVTAQFTVCFCCPCWV